MRFLQEARQKLFGHPHECPPDCQGCTEFLNRISENHPEAIRLRFLTPRVEATSLGPIRACVKDERGITAAICDAAIEGRSAEIGILKDPDIPLRGAADMAFSLMVPKLKELGAREAYGYVVKDNFSSQNFLARNGFTPNIDELDGTRGYDTWSREL